MAFCNDVKNIIALFDHCYRLSGLNKEYRQVFHFIDGLWDNTCPNPHGRCVMICQNAKVHWLNGQFHRIANPAVENTEGFKYWYYQGKLHRPLDEGPAYEDATGNKYWYYYDQRYRPLNKKSAYEYTNGDKYWYKNGGLIRITDNE